MKRQFTKPAIGIQEQLKLLKKRRLQIQCEQRSAFLLRAISYFRLTPYMRPFQVPNDSTHQFQSNASLKSLHDLYEFDRRLRLLVIDAIERIEVAVRAVISNYMGPTYGSHWYLDRSLFKKNLTTKDFLKSSKTNKIKSMQTTNKKLSG